MLQILLLDERKNLHDKRLQALSYDYSQDRTPQLTIYKTLTQIHYKTQSNRALSHKKSSLTAQKMNFL